MHSETSLRDYYETIAASSHTVYLRPQQSLATLTFACITIYITPHMHTSTFLPRWPTPAPSHPPWSAIPSSYQSAGRSLHSAALVAVGFTSTTLRVRARSRALLRFYNAKHCRCAPRLGESARWSPARLLHLRLSTRANHRRPHFTLHQHHGHLLLPRHTAEWRGG